MPNQFLCGLVTVFAGAMIGGGVSGYWLGARFTTERTPHPRIEAQEFVLMSEQRKPVARLYSRKSETALSFHAENGEVALEIGCDRKQTNRFLRFHGRQGRVLVALNSLAPYGAATLYLGDEQYAARIIAGAQFSDVADPQGSRDPGWGIRLRGYASSRPLFEVRAVPDNSPYQRGAVLNIKRLGGEDWSVY
ncbi:MAG: hypothetical protein JNK48_31720 [Bryobacterales bacterium]|nr:hypothetical protein [Bryobacterales bacterium]